VLTTFTVTETYEVTATTVDQVQKAISEDDFSEVQTDLDKRKVTIEPNF
jgi:hypothetical protein